MQAAASTTKGSKADDKKDTRPKRGSVQKIKQVAAAAKSASSKKVAPAAKSVGQQQASRPEMPQADESDTEELLPVKARSIMGKNAMSRRDTAYRHCTTLLRIR